MAKATEVRVVLVTCRSLTEGRKIARAAVQKKVAACVNIGTAPVESVYAWKGKIETAKEYLLILKTTARRLAALEREVKRLNSYETPEYLVVEVKGGAADYLRWVRESVVR